MHLTIGNTFKIQHVLTNPDASPIYINDAAVTVTILDINRVEVSGETWPITLDYVTDSNGVYKKSIAPLGLSTNKKYIVIIDAVGTDNIVGHWEHVVKALRSDEK